jgi:hypothetical protein
MKDLVKIKKNLAQKTKVFSLFIHKIFQIYF